MERVIVRKIFLILLCSAIVLSLSGCGSESKAAKEGKSESAESGTAEESSVSDPSADSEPDLEDDTTDKDFGGSPEENTQAESDEGPGALPAEGTQAESSESGSHGEEKLTFDQIQINTQSSIRIEGTKIIYIDPFEISDETHDADIICITHAHYDHFDPESIRRVQKEDTVYFAPQSMKEDMEKLAEEGQAAYGADQAGEGRLHLLAPGDVWEQAEFSLSTLPAYNLNKQYHPKENQWLGYILTIDGYRYYIAGDTDVIPEMDSVSCDVALIPIGGTYTMTAEEAADMINRMKPAAVIPTHYGSIVGTSEDADTLKARLDPGIEVIIKL